MNGNTKALISIFIWDESRNFATCPILESFSIDFAVEAAVDVKKPCLNPLIRVENFVLHDTSYHLVIN